MTKSNFDPNISSAGSQSNRVEQETDRPRSERKTSVEKSRYQVGQAKDWKRLTNETPSEIGPLIDAVNEQEMAPSRPPTKQELMQLTLRGYLLEDPDELSKSAFELPPVPSVEKMFEEQPTMQINVRPVVDHFIALEKTYYLLIRETEKLLEEEGVNMSPSEVKYRQTYLQHLREGFKRARDELRIAREYHAKEPEARKRHREKIAELALWKPGQTNADED